MVLFYSNNIQDNYAYFDQEESRHIQHALRKDKGAHIHFVDGLGNQYEAKIEDIQRSGIKARILATYHQEPKRKYVSHIAIAPTKKVDRIEWFVEKSIEIGIDKISFIISRHSERKSIKMDRINRIAIAAMKQSMNAHMPLLFDVQSFKDFVVAANEPNKFLAFVPEDRVELNESLYVDGDVCCMIGPEGGFHEEEVSLAEKNNFQLVSLGDRRLRTETAGIVAASFIHEILKV